MNYLQSDKAIVSMFNRHSSAMEVAESFSLRGKVALVTGASSGIGVETSRALAMAGAEVILGVRNLEAGRLVAESIQKESGQKITVCRLDLGDLDSIVSCCDKMQSYHRSLDILVANAGVSKSPESHLANGLDVRFATNHLGHFLLSHLLLENLSVGGGRIIVLSSAAHKGRPVNFDDLQWQTRPHNDLAAYGESKTANILFTMEANRRWSSNGVFVNAVLPGSALTGLQRYHGEDLKIKIGFYDRDGTPNPEMKTVEQAAATSVWAACAPELEGKGGLVLEDCRQALVVEPGTHPWHGFDVGVVSDVMAEKLWNKSLAILENLGIDSF